MFIHQLYKLADVCVCVMDQCSLWMHIAIQNSNLLSTYGIKKRNLKKATNLKKKKSNKKQSVQKNPSITGDCGYFI